MLLTISAKDGTTIWDCNNADKGIYAGNFIPDQDNDDIADILVAHTDQKGKLLDGFDARLIQLLYIFQLIVTQQDI